MSGVSLNKNYSQLCREYFILMWRNKSLFCGRAPFQHQLLPPRLWSLDEGETQTKHVKAVHPPVAL